MKYRIGTLIHDCLQAKGRDLPYWDRGMWLLSKHTLRGGGTINSPRKSQRSDKCPYCNVKLFDPQVCNHLEIGEYNTINNATKLPVTYPALFVAKVDLRKKEFK